MAWLMEDDKSEGVLDDDTNDSENVEARQMEIDESEKGVEYQNGDRNMSGQCGDSWLETGGSDAFDQEREQADSDIISGGVESATGEAQLKGASVNCEGKEVERTSRVIQSASKGPEEVGQERVDDGQDPAQVKMSQSENADPIFRSNPGEFGRRIIGKKRKRNTEDESFKKPRLLPPEEAMANNIDQLDIRSKPSMEEGGL